MKHLTVEGMTSYSTVASNRLTCQAACARPLESKAALVGRRSESLGNYICKGGKHSPTAGTTGDAFGRQC